MKPLVGLLGDGRNANRSQILVAGILSVLAGSGDSTKQAIVHAGGIEPLCRMLGNRSVEAQGKAVSAIFQLASTAIAQKNIADSGGIELLVEQLDEISFGHHSTLLIELFGSRARKVSQYVHT